MDVAHICCGLGGSLWTGEILGWRSVYALDNDEWRVSRVNEHIGAGWWPHLRYDCADLRDWEPPQLDCQLDGIAAGFSCRDISAAGKRAGLNGESTGPTYQGCLRAIGAFQPRWVFFENSPRIKPYRKRIWTDLRNLGYDPRDGTLDASDVGAPHKRRRWFLLAIAADTDGLRELQQARREQKQRGRPSNVCRGKIISDIDGARLQEPVRERGLGAHELDTIEAAQRYCSAYHWNPPNAGLLRVADGVPDRRDKGRRIAGLGDAWVPLQAAAAFSLLSHQFEKENP